MKELCIGIIIHSLVNSVMIQLILVLTVTKKGKDKDMLHSDSTHGLDDLMGTFVVRTCFSLMFIFDYIRKDAVKFAT